ncbi:prepilin-type N-terminal cleavage/methylation domain-containing protein [Ralstonia solanacearum]|uniref:General secretion pathway protein GspG n=1 Tax=Ralstonia solanacearum K60 TaxID=1091042 RepID=A0AAP8D532_RALSL|nr:prepilin-type N-terminal cleavage/methylation domain-containing protein [Ralstonia solanacearum]MBT1538760.1 prepilin-type N-terminal cleavage/methylation domain-containing protein [Ralstonia solanacearum]OYQ14363.1 general secretion pathway protein GspG [Ralstonia solanacearum K60]QOK81733.1 prepilin-type N-terminal cleavage/methylation domain-containing protein [Ralstonia solanacearum]RIJ85794.1 prepilin-type N-terminal cleavage/methylation domain-containing protein [Ralstonia solanacearum
MTRALNARRRGFTLIELVVVMAIIGLLLTLALPRYFHSIERGRAQVQQQNLAVIRDAIDKYYGDNGQYPDTLDDLVAKRYLRGIPVDPVNGSAAWSVMPPPDTSKTGIYDVGPTREAGVPAAASEPVATR